MPTAENPDSRLARSLTTFDGVIIGLGAMIGSGIFVAIGPAVESGGSGILFGIMIAACVAFCNATSSAQLAAVYPESGGTYVYARKQIGPFWGWMAGWSFTVGKLASCSAAALTFGYYLYPSSPRTVALLALAAVTTLNYFGIRKTARVTRVIVFFVLAVLAMVVVASIFGGTADFTRLSAMGTEKGGMGILRSAGLMFFAFAGYARIATLGEEIINPRDAIPRAIVMALGITVLVYLAVSASALIAVGTEGLAASDAPLVFVMNSGEFAVFTPIVRIGAAVATLGVILSLLAGLSRTIFSMAANRDLPIWLAAIHSKYRVPHKAEISVAVLMALIVGMGDIREVVGFSAFTVLLYYTITNTSAFILPKNLLLWPRFFSVAGAASCLVLAFSLPFQTLLGGAGVMALGIVLYNLFYVKSGRTHKTYSNGRIRETKPDG